MRKPLTLSEEPSMVQPTSIFRPVGGNSGLAVEGLFAILIPGGCDGAPWVASVAPVSLAVASSGGSV